MCTDEHMHGIELPCIFMLMSLLYAVSYMHRIEFLYMYNVMCTYVCTSMKSFKLINGST